VGERWNGLFRGGQGLAWPKGPNTTYTNMGQINMPSRDVRCMSPLFCFGCVIYLSPCSPKCRFQLLAPSHSQATKSLVCKTATRFIQRNRIQQGKTEYHFFRFFFLKYSNSSVAWCMETWTAFHCSCQIYSGTKTAHVLLVHRMNAYAHAWVIWFYANM
jgi:hypothetical protein